MADPGPKTPPEKVHCSTRWKAITPHASTNITNQKGNEEIPRAVWVGGAGVVAAVGQDDSVVEFTCAAGSTLPISPKRINAVNTTATLMVAMF